MIAEHYLAAKSTDERKSGENFDARKGFGAGFFHTTDQMEAAETGDARE
jgi:hypothetical protein